MKTSVALLATLGVFAGSLLSEAQTSENHSFNDINLAIPDGNASGLSQVHTVSSTISSLASVRVRLRIDGEFNGDLYGYLRHVHDGTTNFCVLLNRVGRTSANPSGYSDGGLDVLFEETAANGDIHAYREVAIPESGLPLTGSWQPDGRRVDPGEALDSSERSATLSQFHGADASGEWTLFLADMGSGGAHLLVSWSLEFSGVATPTIAWSAPSGIVYGTALSGDQLNAAATYDGSPVPGTFTYTPAAGTVLNSGNDQLLGVLFTPTDPASYGSVTYSVTINVAKAPLTVTASPASREYGDLNPTFTGTIVGIQNNDTITAAYSTDADVTSSAGTYAIIPLASGPRLSHYAVSHVNGTLTVVKAPLTVTGDDKSRLYGAANPSLTGLVTGTKNGDAIVVSYGTSATLASPVGVYPIAPEVSGPALVNYEPAIENGTLTITPASLLVSAVDASRVYGAPNPTFTGTTTGLLNGDQVTVVYTTVANASSSVGTYDIVPAVSGDALSNYVLQVTEGTLSVTAATTVASLAASANPVPPGQSVSFTMAVDTLSPSTAIPTGSVQFKVDGVAVGAPVPLVNGLATLSSSSLSHASHIILAEYPGTANLEASSDSLTLVVNTLPEAHADVVVRYGTGSVKTSIVALLANDVDTDGDPLSFEGVNSASTHGAIITIREGWVYYAPPDGFTDTDTFTYHLSDNFGTPVAGTVTVEVDAGVGPSYNVTVSDLGNGSFQIWGDGIPGRSYHIEFTLSLVSPNWQRLGTVMADEFGFFGYVDLAGSAMRAYRAVCP
ncbi:MAG: MBG domain-containing protein [Verrucomicrobiia bacterium]